MAIDSLPHDLEIERAALAALLLAPQRAAEAVDLSPVSFYSDKNRTIFLGIVECLRRYTDGDGRPTADLKLLVGVLRETGQLEKVGDVEFVASILDGFSRSANLAAYVRILREYEAKRDALKGAVELARAARENNVADVRAVLETVAAKLKRQEAHESLSTMNILSVLTGAEIEIPWLVEGWLGAGDLAFLAGEWGTGKSLIALDLAISIASGNMWVGKIPIAKTGPVLYFDEENNPVNAARRFRRMIHGREIEPLRAAELPIHYYHGNGVNLDSRRGRGLIQREVDRHGPRLIVLDSLIRFHRRDENKNSTMAAFFEDAVRPLTRQGVAVLALDHLRKPVENDKDGDVAHRLRGAGDKAGVADAVWTLEGSRDEPTRSFQCRKIRWEDSLPPPLTTRWTVSEDESAAWIEAKDERLSAEAAILTLLGGINGDGMRATELYDALEHRGVPRRSAIRVVKRMVKERTLSEKRHGSRGKSYAMPVA